MGSEVQEVTLLEVSDHQPLDKFNTTELKNKILELVVLDPFLFSCAGLLRFLRVLTYFSVEQPRSPKEGVFRGGQNPACKCLAPELHVLEGEWGGGSL